MGAWGTGPLDNDDAADFVGDLCELTDQSAIATALGDAFLAVVGTEEYIEAPDMSNAIAAATVVARLKGTLDITDAALSEEWISNVAFHPSDLLVGQAAKALARALVADDNEWYELWAEVDALDEVTAKLEPIRRALD